jgi:intracellular sulfur oxidation DsrE/DsrF family protein
MGSNQGIVVHITSGESSDWEMALRNLLNLAQSETMSTPADRIWVVVNGEPVRFLLESAKGASEITEMAEAGVQIGACSNSLDRFGHDPADLTDGVSTVDSGVAEVARLQRQGNAYLKLP